MSQSYKQSKFFIEGKIDTKFISRVISEENKNFKTGGQFFFLGQVRNDTVNGKEVKSILYSAYPEMAEKLIEKIITEIKNEFSLNSIKVFHSIGNVKAGEISFFVFASASHRKDIFKAVEVTVYKIKKEVPIWKKEVF